MWLCFAAGVFSGDDGNVITSRKPDDLPAFMQMIFQTVKEAKPAMAGAR